MLDCWSVTEIDFFAFSSDWIRTYQPALFESRSVSQWYTEGCFGGWWMEVLYAMLMLLPGECRDILKVGMGKDDFRDGLLVAEEVVLSWSLAIVICWVTETLHMGQMGVGHDGTGNAVVLVQEWMESTIGPRSVVTTSRPVISQRIIIIIISNSQVLFAYELFRFMWRARREIRNKIISMQQFPLYGYF